MRTVEDPTQHLPDLLDVRYSPDCQIALRRILDTIRSQLDAVAVWFDDFEVDAIDTGLTPFHLWPSLQDYEGELGLVAEIRYHAHQDEEFELRYVLPQEVRVNEADFNCFQIPGGHFETEICAADLAQAWRHAFALRHEELLRQMQGASNRNRFSLAAKRRKELLHLEESWLQKGLNA